MRVKLGRRTTLTAAQPDVQMLDAREGDSAARY